MKKEDKLFYYGWLLILIMLAIYWLTSCTEPITPDPPAPDLAEFIHRDCNDQEFAITQDNYYDIFWFGRYYTYRYKGIIGDQYYFQDGGLGYFCSYEDLITLIELCDIKLKT